MTIHDWVVKEDFASGMHYDGYKASIFTADTVYHDAVSHKWSSKNR